MFIHMIIYYKNDSDWGIYRSIQSNLFILYMFSSRWYRFERATRRHSNAERKTESQTYVEWA